MFMQHRGVYLGKYLKGPLIYHNSQQSQRVKGRRHHSQETTGQEVICCNGS